MHCSCPMNSARSASKKKKKAKMQTHEFSSVSKQILNMCLDTVYFAEN